MKFKIIAFFLIVTILFSGCLTETSFSQNETTFDVKPSELTVQNNDSGQIMIRVANNGKSSIHPVVNFNMNSSDKQHVDFTPITYDLGILWPGEDSGFRIVKIKARITAGMEIKYPVRAEVVNNGSVIEGKDIVIIVKR